MFHYAYYIIIISVPVRIASLETPCCPGPHGSYATVPSYLGSHCTCTFTALQAVSNRSGADGLFCVARSWSCRSSSTIHGRFVAHFGGGTARFAVVVVVLLLLLLFLSNAQAGSFIPERTYIYIYIYLCVFA
jgi:hypothetical protein